MYDGGIISDEQSALGEVPEIVRRSMYFMPHKTTEDDLAGVSALMNNLPDVAVAAKTPRKKAKKAAKPRTYKARPRPKAKAKK
jgi:hypothetical protein